jgi:prolyl-tRNA synthetase
VPVRLAMGLRDMENNVVELARRDTKEKQQVSIVGLSGYIIKLLDEIQQNLYNNALEIS